MFTKWKTHLYVLKAFSYLQHEKHLFEEISCLQNAKARFWSAFMFTKWKNNFFKHFSRLQNQFKTLLKHFHFYKMKSTRFWSDFMLTKSTKTSFWSVLHVYKIKHIFEVFPCLSNKQKTFLKRFHVYNLKKLCFWSVFISNIVIILQKKSYISMHHSEK